MIKKLIYLFCGTLVLTACGNSIEKKANENGKPQVTNS